MKKEEIKKFLIKIQKEQHKIIDKFNISIEGSVCDTSSKFKDVISFYILNENGIIKDISGKCGPCDPYAYITINILSKILKGLKLKDIRLDNDEIYKRFVRELGTEMDDDMRFHFETILKIVQEKVTS
ncbi:MAG: hypothetical protein XD76_1145 [candidate division TA06 bacterium 32_111]|uniref:NIF system FeS cluster assembly NifU N-terminal domain-containing protein n=2 Tax=Bacteria candidate phyla TaxID=1783234 RepID=A0A101I405_UNCT6|nr:MAG: hypothetical protein XD76_1145 [candidate division TA06 bacterium 32_111]KUK87480.1 MAG: hypothetical protein XE03_0647 [candidate division TA06 bacterium 34_109]HAF08183.1 hypothetical protein [candidate division WOR-3 bacterium]HCP16745.1 hypothetical protein [candidate division WOR-3 bacterium]